MGTEGRHGSERDGAGRQVPRGTLGEVLAQRAGEHPTKPAVIAGRTWTYAELAGLAGDERIATAEPHDVIAVTATTRAHMAVATLAAATHGAAAPIAFDLADEPRAALLARLRPAIHLDGDDFCATPPAFSERHVHTSVYVALGKAGMFDDPAIVVSTSGTTAAPKLVPNTHRNLWASAVAAAAGQDLGPDDRTLALGSMAHVLGLRAAIDALWCGGAVIVPDDLTVDAIAAHLVRHRPTCVVASPPMFGLLASALESLDDDDREGVVESIRFVRSGAAALRSALRERLRTLLRTPVLHGYGMSEAAKIACGALDGSSPPGSVGRPLGVELKIVDGEVVVRGDCVAPGYFDHAHRSASTFEDGWFHTGDVGRLDDNGNLFLLGRRDEVVSRGGELLSLTALEEALEEHPAVATALAAAIEHPSLGTDVVLAYVGHDGERAGVGELRAFVGARVGAIHAPTRIMRLDDLPLSSTGKPSRQALVALVGAPRRASEGAVALPEERGPELNGVEVRLAALWAEILLLDTAVAADDDFFALGADSLHLVELCSAIEREFAVELMPGELIERPRLAEMASMVRNGRPRRKRQARPLLVPMRHGGRERIRLFVIPGRGGTLAQGQRFVYQLEPGRTIDGFEAPGIYFGERPIKRIDRLAARYADEVLAALDDGEPFALLGLSLGTTIVHEMAHVLEGRGRPPAVVVMFDGIVPSHQKPRKRPRWRQVAATVRHPSRLRPDDRGLRPRITRVANASQRAGARHRPSVITTPAVLFTTDMHRTRTGDPLLGWGPYLGGGVTTIEFPGLHNQLTRSMASATAPALDRLLAAHDAGITAAQ